MTEESDFIETGTDYYYFRNGIIKIDIKDILRGLDCVTYLNPINCSDGGAVLAGCAAFVVVASSHHSGKAERKLEKLSGDGEEEEEERDLLVCYTYHSTQLELIIFTNMSYK